MPFYSITYVISNQGETQNSIILCGRCRQRATWYPGSVDTPDMPIQLRCDNCLNQCAEFSTEEARDEELRKLEERARAMNSDLYIDQPNRA